MKNLDLPGPHEASESDAAAAAGHDGQLWDILCFSHGGLTRLQDSTKSLCFCKTAGIQLDLLGESKL